MCLRSRLCSIPELKNEYAFPGIAYDLQGRQITLQPDMVSAIKTEVTTETYGKSWTVMATDVFLDFNT